MSRDPRLYLADILEQSLTSGEFATAEIAAEWTEEIDRRLAAYDRGETHVADAGTALKRIRIRLARHRSLKVTE